MSEDASQGSDPRHLGTMLSRDDTPGFNAVFEQVFGLDSSTG
jgi:hypothetical protein